MRVIAGKARSMPLQTIEGKDTRPTTDRIKETLFNILQDRMYGCRFLDLFAGSGAIGIEALSRNGSYAVFVEQNRKAAECIRKNLIFTKLIDQAQIMQSDVFRAIKLLEGTEKEPFDIIFMDPPYNNLLEKQVLEQLSASPLVGEDTLIIAEASLQTEFDYLDSMGYEIVKCKKYKTNVHMFLRRKEK